jgi:two-component system LytT family sensor kinase
VRFGPALSVEYELAPETETVLLPLLTVQPLVENAIQHGLAQKIGGGRILIKTRTVTDGDVEISVEDNGVGIGPESLTHLKRNQTSSSGLGLALHNINERLQKIYGPDYQLTIKSQLGIGTEISFRIPRLKRI